MQTTKNYGLRKPESTDFYNIEDMNYNADVMDEKMKESMESIDSAKTHIANKSNPHAVTKAQVGLSNVPNVTTNNQTPTYTIPSALGDMTSGEKLYVAFGKIAKAVSSLINIINGNTAVPKAVKATNDSNGNEIVTTYATNHKVEEMFSGIESGARNLVPFPYFEKAGTESGITWTVNDDGTIGVSGTATANVSFTVRATSENWILPKGTYTLSGCPAGGSFAGYRLQLARFIDGTLTSYANEYGNGSNFEVTDDFPLLFQFVVANGVTIDATVKPMLECVNHSFVPYYFGGAEKAKTAENAADATHAISADNADKLDGFDSSDFLKTKGGGTVEYENFNGFKVKRNVEGTSGLVGIAFQNASSTVGVIGFKNGKLHKTDVTGTDSNEILDASNIADYAADFEEGTFDLTLEGRTLSGYKYTRIGKFVYLSGVVPFNGESLTIENTTVYVQGLPFEIASIPYIYFGDTLYTPTNKATNNRVNYSDGGTSFGIGGITLANGTPCVLHAMYITR